LGFGWEYATVAPTIHPAVINMITNRGAIDKTQKKASDAPVVGGLPAIQLCAAQLASAINL